MLLSLLETIFVMYLMERDSQDNEANGDQSGIEDCNRQDKALNNSDRGETRNQFHVLCLSSKRA